MLALEDLLLKDTIGYKLLYMYKWKLTNFSSFQFQSINTDYIS